MIVEAKKIKAISMNNEYFANLLVVGEIKQKDVKKVEDIEKDGVVATYIGYPVYLSDSVKNIGYIYDKTEVDIAQEDIDYINKFTSKKEDRQFKYYIISKYKSNRWWKSSDMKTIAYFQLLEPIALINNIKFLKAIEILLDRCISFEELALNFEYIKQEAIIKYIKYKKEELS